MPDLKMTEGKRGFIRAVVNVNGAQGVENARHTVELAYRGSEVLYRLPEGAEVTGTVELSATTCLPSWSHEFYVEDPREERTLVCRLSILSDCTLLAYVRDLSGENYCECIDMGNLLIDLEKTPQALLAAIPWVRSLEFYGPTPDGAVIGDLLFRVVSPVPYCGGSSSCSKAEVSTARELLRLTLEEHFSGPQEADECVDEGMIDYDPNRWWMGKTYSPSAACPRSDKEGREE